MSEILGALFAIMAGLLYLPQVTHGIATQRQIMADVTTAQQQQQWVSAVSNYVSQNNATYLASANASTPVAISVAAVKAANVGLPASFSGTNPFNQTWAAGVLQPSAGTLQVLVYATGGNAIKDEELGSIARASNGAGGFIPTNNSGAYPGGAATAHGAFGAWTMSTAGFGAPGGVPASLLTLSNGALTSNALYRYAVAGQPQLNQMQTAIDMNNNNVNNAATVNAKNVVTPAGNSVQVGNSYLYGDNTNSAIRQTGALYVQNPAGTAYGAVNAGTVNANGNVTASNMVIAQSDVDSYGNLWSNNYVIANRDVNAYGNLWTQGNLSVGGTAWIASNTAMGANTTISNSGTQYIEAAGNLYLKPWNGNGTTIVGGGGGSGNLTATGSVQANGNVNANNVVSAQNYLWGNNAVITNGYVQAYGNIQTTTNMSANDYWVGAAGKWASQLGSFKGAYVVRYYNGTNVVPDGTGCQPNPVTGGCSCPAGSGDWDFTTGQSYYTSQWDGTWHLHMCF